MINKRIFGALLLTVAQTCLVVGRAPAQAPGPPQMPQPGPMQEPAAPEPAAPRAPQAPAQAPQRTGPTGNGVIRIESRDAMLPADAVTQAEGDRISITLDDVPLEDVVRMFTRISGANIIASASDLTGSVTVNLTDVKWKPALSSILDMHGLSLVEKQPGSGVYSVVTRPADAPKAMVTKSFTLQFATVSDIKPVVTTMLAEGATLSEFPSRNIIVVRSTPENLSEIADIVKDIDQPTKQVCVETKFMELSDEATKQLGIRWDSLAEYAVKLDAGPFEWTESKEWTKSRTDARSRWDLRQNVDSVTRAYDQQGAELVLNPEIETVEFPDSSYVTLETFDPTRTVEDTIDLGDEYTSDFSQSFLETVTEASAAILQVDDFELVLSALKQMDGVSIISNPKLIVANGSKDAFFSVGEREPIIKTEVTLGTTESPGDKITAELDTSINTDYIKDGYLATGIDLRVIPTVKTDDLIEAEINPSLKRKTGTKTVEDNSWPIISVKEIKTRFTLRSGQTVAIGGLTDTSDETEESKIPLLGDIPLIGKYLFSHTKEVKSQIETIIFVTLSLAEPERLRNKAGIPENAELVHKKMIERREYLQKMHEGIRKLEAAAKAKAGDAPQEDESVEPMPEDQED